MASYRIAFVRQVFGTEWARRSYECIRTRFPDALIDETAGTPPKIWTACLKPLLDQCHFRRRWLPGASPLAASLSSPHGQQGRSESRTVNPAWMLRQYLARRIAFDPLRPVLRGLNLPVDYVVHVDEDCFLLDADQLRETIEYMERHPEVLLAGPADGGTPYREVRNPFACNLFFNVIKREPVRRLMEQNPKWRRLRFADLPREVVSEIPDRGTPARPVACDEPFHLDDYEPYYPLYWLILGTGHRIWYLPTRMTEDERRASSIRLVDRTKDMCFHMWYVREWVAGSKMVVYGIDNFERYDHARSFLVATEGRS
jgi:hypothetical protein